MYHQSKRPVKVGTGVHTKPPETCCDFSGFSRGFPPVCELAWIGPASANNGSTNCSDVPRTTGLCSSPIAGARKPLPTLARNIPHFHGCHVAESLPVTGVASSWISL